MNNSKKGSQCWIEIIVLLIAIFFIFIVTVLAYENKIDELEKRINEFKEQCIIK